MRENKFFILFQIFFALFILGAAGYLTFAVQPKLVSNKHVLGAKSIGTPDGKLKLQYAFNSFYIKTVDKLIQEHEIRFLFALKPLTKGTYEIGTVEVDTSTYTNIYVWQISKSKDLRIKLIDVSSEKELISYPSTQFTTLSTSRKIKVIIRATKNIDSSTSFSLSFTTEQ